MNEIKIITKCTVYYDKNLDAKNSPYNTIQYNTIQYNKFIDLPEEGFSDSIYTRIVLKLT